MSTVSFDELFAKAREAVGAGDYDYARSLYSQVVSAAPDSVDGHYGLATSYYMLGDLHSAKRHFEEVTRLDPRRATAFINLGALYNRLGEQDQAIATLRRGLQLDPRRAEGYYNLGIAYRQKGLVDLAIQAYREATRLNPRMADAFLNLGNLLLESERFQESIVAYEQALAVRPNFEKAAHGLRSAQQLLENRTAQAVVPPQPTTSPTTDSSHELSLGSLPTFANVVDRAEAIESLRESCGKQEELCREIARVIEQELGPAIRDLSRSLVGTPAAGELELHVSAYEASLDNLRTARVNMDNGFQKIHELGLRFAAAAQAADRQPV